MCQLCNCDYWIQELEGYMNEPAFKWAFDTLDGIHTNVIANKHITEKQIRALQNIIEAQNRYEK